MRILAFGDSFTYGSWDTEGGWADRLKREVHTRTVDSAGKQKSQLLNLGIGGDTSTKLLERLPAEVIACQHESWRLGFIFMFGSNDARSNRGAVETPLVKFVSNIRAIIRLAQQFSDQIAFVGIPPVLGGTATLYGTEFSDERAADYDERLLTVVVGAGLPYIGLRTAFEAAGLDNIYSYDHIHPNDAGHKLIADAVRPYLSVMLSQQK